MKDLAGNMKTNLLSFLQNCTFASLKEESIDMDGYFASIWPISESTNIKEDSLSCECLITNMSSTEMFSIHYLFKNLLINPGTTVLTLDQTSGILAQITAAAPTACSYCNLPITQ